MKHLLQTKSPLFKLIFLVTMAFGIWIHLNTPSFKTLTLLVTHVVLIVLSSLLILFALIPWYGFKYKGLGIDDHYQKVLVIVTYSLMLYLGLTYFNITLLPLNIFLIVIFLLLLIINTTLLSYHLKDPSKTPPAYFAANLYLNKDHAPKTS